MMLKPTGFEWGEFKTFYFEEYGVFHFIFSLDFSPVAQMRKAGYRKPSAVNLGFTILVLQS